MSNLSPILPLWPDSKIVDESRSVYRVPFLSDLTFGPSKPPPVEIFNLTDTDKSDGISKNIQPLLSVWDSEISLDEISSRRKKNSEKKLVVFEAKVELIHKITTKKDYAPVKVVKDDLLGDPLGSLHYGLQGLYHDKDRVKTEYKNVKSQLQQIFTFKSEI